jgi:orotate phosphoribosyltransferase
LRALWIHDGNPKRPHALLTSGLHSNGFFNSSFIIRNPKLLAKVCWEMCQHVRYTETTVPDMVVGSAMGAVTIAYEIARLMELEAGFTENVEGEMLLKRFPIRENSNVLVVEDVLTSGSTTIKTIAGIEKAGGIVEPVILAIVNRSGMDKLDGRRIIALISHHLPVWQAEDCPLCQAGSPVLRPKSNWSKLNASY